MAVTIYTLGDHEIIQAALNGVAMLFNPNAGLLTGYGGLGLGHAAGLGLMVGILFVVSRGLFQRSFEPHWMLIVLVGYIALFVPTTTVYIENMETGQVAVVDDIPIGIAYPGGIVSSFTHSFTQNMETVMRTADAEYVSMTENGFASPLKVILAARSAAVANPLFSSSWVQFMYDCGTDIVNPQRAMQETSIMRLLDTIANDPGINGRLTMVYTDATPGGTLVTCKEAADNLVTQYGDLISTPPPTPGTSNPANASTFELYMNQGMSIRKPSGTTTGQYWTKADLEAALITVGSGMVDQQKATGMLILGDLTRGGMECGAPNGSSSFVTCAGAIRDSMERYKVGAATNASMFSKTIVPTMNVFLFFFYAIAPVVALLVLMMPHQAIKLLGGYFLLGIWSQSWIMGGAVVNYFMQLQTRKALSPMLYDGGWTLGHATQVYDMLSLKLAAASDLLAAMPMVMMALLSGSVYALTKVADRSSGADATPSGVDSGPALKVDPLYTEQGHSSINDARGKRRAGASGPIYQASYDASVNETAGSGYEAASTQQRTRAMELAKTLGVTLGQGIAGATTSASGTDTAVGWAQSTGFDASKVHKLSNGLKSTLEEAGVKDIGVNLNKVLNAGIGAMGAVLKKGGPLKQALEAGKAALGEAANGLKALIPDAKARQQFADKLDKTFDETFSADDKEFSRWAADYKSGKYAKTETNFVKQSLQKFDKGLGESLRTANQEADMYSEKASQVKSASASGGGRASFDELTAAQIGHENAAAGEELIKASGKSEQELDHAGKQYAKTTGQLQGAENADRRRIAAAFQALVNAKKGALAADILNRGAGGIGPSPSSKLPTHDGVTAGAGGKLATTKQETGLTPTEKEQIDSAGNEAKKSAQTAQQKTSNVPQQIENLEAASRKTPGYADFQNAAGKMAYLHANSSDAKNYFSATRDAKPSSEFTAEMEKRRKAWGDTHGFDDLAKSLWNSISSDPAIGSAMAGSVFMMALDAATSFATSEEFGKIKDKALEFGKRVGKKLGPIAAKMGARHMAGSAAGAVTGPVGEGLINAALLVPDAADLAGVLKEAYDETMGQQHKPPQPQGQGQPQNRPRKP